MGSKYLQLIWSSYLKYTLEGLTEQVEKLEMS